MLQSKLSNLIKKQSLENKHNICMKENGEHSSNFTNLRNTNQIPNKSLIYTCRGTKLC